jgi:pimeloyl-ACP methyl ester carboxylesterase
LAFDVTEGGPPDGPPVLLLHGFPQHSGQWDLVTPALWAAGLRTYAMDQRGYAPGARPADVAAFTLAEGAADALAVLDVLGAGRAHVVGHDWGALVGWHLAAHHRARLLTLTAVSVPHPAAVAVALSEDLDQRKRSAYVALFRKPGIAERVLQSADGAALRLVLRGVPADRVERYLAPLREPGALTPRLNWYRALVPAELGRLPAVDLPTTFVWSDRDVAIGRTAARRCAGFVTGDYRFVPVPGASHWLPDEAPDEVAAAVLDRVARAARPASPPRARPPATTDTFADLGQRADLDPWKGAEL